MRSELPEGWRFETLGDHVDLLVGFAFPSKHFSDTDGVRLLRGDNVAQGYMRWEKTKRWRREIGDGYDSYELEPGDVVLAMDRPWIEAGLKWAVIRDGDLPALLVQRVARLRPRQELDQSYLGWLVADPRFMRYIRAVHTGTAVPHVSANQIKDYPIALPPRFEQRAIANVLAALHEKLASNERTIQLLGMLGEAVFASRFAQSTKLPVDGETRPPGWVVGSLGDFFDVEMGQSPPGASYGSDSERGPLLVQGIGGFGPRFPKSCTYTSSPTKVTSRGSTLMTVRAPVGAINIADQETCLGRGVVAFMSSAPGFTEFFVRALARRWGSQESGTIFPAINHKQIVELPVAIPTTTEIQEFEALISPLVDQLAMLDTESHRLRAIRDALLPKLVSGQIRASAEAFSDPSDAANALEEAAA